MAKRAKSTGPREIAPRYGIAEWYGADLLQMSDIERQSRGRLAARQQQEGKTVDAPKCPFLSNFIPGARCNKSGGVCTIRKYNSHGKPVTDDLPVTVCPNRFLDRFEDGSSLFDWISDKMLDVEDPIVVRETPFLRRIPDVSVRREVKEAMEAEARQEEKKAGRIDWILVDPRTLSAPELGWCAVETQALYFSGGKMRAEFDAYAQASSGVLFPAGKRRPDYRSSGPKRLWPQLDVKVPVLRDWHKKG